jgi:hypothetical protein
MWPLIHRCDLWYWDGRTNTLTCMAGCILHLISYAKSTMYTRSRRLGTLTVRQHTCACACSKEKRAYRQLVVGDTLFVCVCEEKNVHLLAMYGKETERMSETCFCACMHAWVYLHLNMSTWLTNSLLLCSGCDESCKRSAYGPRRPHRPLRSGCHKDRRCVCMYVCMHACMYVCAGRTVHFGIHAIQFASVFACMTHISSKHMRICIVRTYIYRNQVHVHRLFMPRVFIKFICVLHMHQRVCMCATYTWKGICELSGMYEVFFMLDSVNYDVHISLCMYVNTTIGLGVQQPVRMHILLIW